MYDFQGCERPGYGDSQALVDVPQTRVLHAAWGSNSVEKGAMHNSMQATHPRLHNECHRACRQVAHTSTAPAEHPHFTLLTALLHQGSSMRQHPASPTYLSHPAGIQQRLRCGAPSASQSPETLPQHPPAAVPVRLLSTETAACTDSASLSLHHK